MHKLAAPLVMLLVFLALSPAVMAKAPSGEDDAIYAAITYPAGSYDVGSKVDITVHVWDAGKYTTVDGVEVNVGFDFYNPHKVPMAEQATGRWKGNFTILQADIQTGSSSIDMRYVPISAQVIKGGTTVEFPFSSLDLATKATDRLTVKAAMGPASSYGTPGETRTLTWLVRLGTTLVDAAPATLQVDGTPATPAKVATGTYRYTYTFPSGTHSSSADIDFRAEYMTADNRTLEAQKSTSLYLNFLHVWAKRTVTVTAAGATFDLYVSNWTGRPVAGATINLAYSYDDDDSNQIEKNLTASTDSNGVARVELVYNDLGLEEYKVEVSGNVSGQGKVQDLEFSLFVRTQDLNAPSPPAAEGFDVQSSKVPLFKFDKAVQYTATAYWNAAPMPTAKVYYYIHSSNAVLAASELSTGATGALAVDFTTPQKGAASVESVYAHFETGINDSVQTQYYTHDDVFMVSNIDLTGMQFSENIASVLNSYHDDSVKIKVATLKKGEPVAVTVSASGVEDWQCMVIVGNDPNPASLGFVPEWTYWTRGVANGLYSDTTEYKDGKWQGAMFIPTNLPDKNFFVFGGVFNNNIDNTQITDLKDVIKINRVDGLEVGSSGGGGGGGGGGGLGGLLDTKVLGIPLLLFIIIIIVIIVAGVAAGIVISRSKRAKPAPEAPGEPVAAAPAEEGPRFASGPGPAAPMPGYQPQPQYMPQGEPPAVYAPQQPQYPAQPQYAPQPSQQPQPQPQYAPQPQAQYAPPPAPAPQQPQYAPAPQPQPQQQQWVPPPAPAPQQPQYAPQPAPQPAARPTAPQQPPAAPPRPAAAPAAAAPAAAAGTVSEMMTIKCQRCGTKLSIPRKRPIKVTCPNCGASGVLK
jgi:DNA-directed RNA polymerase subunit RPC12/RpoP